MRHREPRVALLAAAIATVLLGGCIIPSDPSVTVDFTVSPQPAAVGEAVEFLPVGYDPDVEYDFDLDGDGAFDDGSMDPANSRMGPRWTYTTPGPHTVSMDIRRNAFMFISIPPLPVFVHEYATKQIDVRAPATAAQEEQPPAASFTTDANPGYTERAVRFDASRSSDPEGRLVSYQWDFENDGTFDQQSATPTATHAYDAPGTYDARLRVTDAAGLTNDTTRAVPIVDGVPPEKTSAGLRAARLRGGTPFTYSMTARITDQGDTFLLNGALSQVGIVARGQMKLRDLPQPFTERRRARWAANVTLKQRGNGDAARFATEGYMLIDLGRGDRMCMSGRVAGALNDANPARLSLVGGSGVAARLRGAAEFPVTQTTRQRGRIRLTPTRRARPLAKPCRTLARVLRAR